MASSKITDKLSGTVFYHQFIMDAVRARDSVRAAESMRQHLQAILDVMQQLSQQPSL
jgi:DNA-binding GntR family transcriptional regulator